MYSVSRESQTIPEHHMKRSIRSVAALVMLGMLMFVTSYGWSQDKASEKIYIVQSGDFLVKIAIRLGNPNYWEAIYQANRDKIDDPDLIFIGQKLVIPDSLTTKKEFLVERTIEQKSKATKTDSIDQMEAFRKAFEKVLAEQRAEARPQPEPPRVANYNGLEINGLVINETRSKVGDQFFNIFYQHWDAPRNAPNFMLKITERPMPSMGTLVTVFIDNTPVFRSKLQPRRSVIEEQAFQAVAISYQTLAQRIETANQLTVY
jgi:curli production assembly/transport component CsgE